MPFQDYLVFGPGEASSNNFSFKSHTFLNRVPLKVRCQTSLALFVYHKDKLYHVFCNHRKVGSAPCLLSPHDLHVIIILLPPSHQHTATIMVITTRRYCNGPGRLLVVGLAACCAACGLRGNGNSGDFVITGPACHTLVKPQ